MLSFLRSTIKEIQTMKYKVIRIIGVLLLVLGAALIVLQLSAREKSFIGSIAAGSTPITVGAVLVGISSTLENKKKRLSDPADKTK